jgi:hypothetical protein
MQSVAFQTFMTTEILNANGGLEYHPTDHELSGFGSIKLFFLCIAISRGSQSASKLQADAANRLLFVLQSCWQDIDLGDRQQH